MNYIELFDHNRPLGRYDLPQDVLSDDGKRIRLVRAVRGGGNGVVMEARLPTGTVCAVKLLLQRDESRIDRFGNEARVLSVLDHPNIAKYYGFGELTLRGGITIPWIAMELGGMNLREHVQKQGPLPVDVLKPAAVQMCDALTHLHEKAFIHRDVKPDNFVWDRDVDGNIQMIDFGIAKRVNEDVSARPLDQFTTQQEFVGPVFFSSPELIAYANDKSHPVDRRSDLFQLGKVLWFLATSRITAGVPSRKNCPAGGRLWDIVMFLLQDDPNSRPNWASDVARELRKL